MPSDSRTPDDAPTPLGIAWEQSSFAADRPIAVEVTFTAPEMDDDHVRRLPLNVGLSIDRSGSMSGEKLAAARRAAVGLVDGLADGERLAATAFDDTVIDVTPGVVLNDSTRERIRGRIHEIGAGGTTALFDGFARTAELVANGGAPGESDSWVIVLSDGMGNQGLTDPAAMRVHSGSLADRGIRTTTVGIGEDYEAAQLTALSDGGGGEFHHATNPGEIVEIVLGELRSLRATTVRDLRVSLTAHARRWRLLGGKQVQHGDRRDVRFDRVNGGRTVRAVALFWPTRDGVLPRVSTEAAWTDLDNGHRSVQASIEHAAAPDTRDIALAVRAANLWHASIVARALELNERGEHERAERFVRRARRDFKAYVAGLPGVGDLLESLRRIQDRVGSEWRTSAHREAYVMARKSLLVKDDLRSAKPASYVAALSVVEKR
jgi:Ca-activated chloride channel family protein